MQKLIYRLITIDCMSSVLVLQRHLKYIFQVQSFVIKIQFEAN